MVNVRAVGVESKRVLFTHTHSDLSDFVGSVSDELMDYFSNQQNVFAQKEKCQYSIVYLYQDSFLSTYAFYYEFTVLRNQDLKEI